MIDFFQMNSAIAGTGLKTPGNAQAKCSAGEGLFSILLNNLNRSSETGSNSLGSSLFTGSFLTDTIITEKSASSVTAAASLGKAGEVPDQTSVQSSDFVFPESAMPDLISFLQMKGFSPEQTDSILLSSLNNEGLIQLNKLAMAIQSAKAGKLADETGLAIGPEFVPKVQELLFNMGLGVGEVKAVVEKSGDQKGGISLDKLADALNGQMQGTFTKTELVSLLEQNNISVTSQAGVITASAPRLTDKTSIDPRPSYEGPGISAPEKAIANGREFSGVSGVEYTMESNADAAYTVSERPNSTPGVSQGNDINKAAIELKKEFMNFVGGSTVEPEGTERQKGAALSGEKILHAQELKSVSDAAETVNTGASKAAAHGSVRDEGSMAQALSKGQTQWQKGDEGKIIDILNGENSSNVGTDGRAVFKGQREIMQDSAGSLKQDGHKAGQEIVTGSGDGKGGSQIQTTEGADLKEGLLNIREMQQVDPATQNLSRIAEDAVVKTQVKNVYHLPEPLPKVFERMVVMIKNGEQTGKLMIQPPELGRIDIDLTIKSGHIQANLTTENIAVKEIIEANLNQLKQQLNDQGLVVEQFNVSVGSQNRQFREESGQAWGSGKGSSGSEVSGMEDAEDATAEGTPHGMSSNRYRIDVHV